MRLNNALLFLLGIALSISAEAEQRVLASIKPLQLIAQAVVGDRYPVQVLLPPGATPHHYSLRPSDMRKVDQADLIIWLGTEAETYLAKPLGRADQSYVEINLEEYLERGADRYADPHLWLSSRYALRIAGLIADRLAELDPMDETIYRANLHTFALALDRLHGQFSAELKQQEIRYLVYHDAYGYFEREYGLSHLGVVTPNPEVNPGARHLLQLQNRITEQKIDCILVEPESNGAVVRALLAGQPAKQLLIDPMASNIALGPKGYLEFLSYVMETFQQCQR